jgi:hypothetical protein
MKNTDRQPILETLSHAEKDDLILRLWDDLCEARARLQALEARLADQPAAPHAGASALRGELRKHASDKPAAAPAASHIEPQLGRGVLHSKFVLGAIAFVALAFALDTGVGWYQRHRLEQKRLADRALEHAAYSGLYVDLVNVAYEPDQKSYRLTMMMRNLDPAHPLYVMLSPVRAFEQAGLAWREIPARAPRGGAATVVKVTDQQAYETVFEPNLKEWTELIPGYMHIRFESTSLVSGRSEPEDDIIDRRDRYYVYLKPHGADDAALRQRMKYPGDPPVYIPMPPH